MFDKKNQDLSSTGNGSDNRGFNGNCHYAYAYTKDQFAAAIQTAGGLSRVVSVRFGYHGSTPVAMVESMKPELQGTPGDTIHASHISGFRTLKRFQLEGNRILASGAASIKAHELFGSALEVHAAAAEREGKPTTMYAPLGSAPGNPDASWTATWSNGKVNDTRKLRDLNRRSPRSAAMIGATIAMVVGNRTLVLAKTADEATQGGKKFDVYAKLAEQGSVIATQLPPVSKDGWLFPTTLKVNAKGELESKLHQIDLSSYQKGTGKPASIAPQAELDLAGRAYVCTQGQQAAVYATPVFTVDGGISSATAPISFAAPPRIEAARLS